MRTFLAFTATCLISLSLFSQNHFNPVKMDSLLDVYVSKNRIMATVGLSYDGKLVYQKATGCSWCEENGYADANVSTKYRIGSITKTFTSVLVLQLVEQKKLKLNTPLSKFFPKFTNAKSITIEHLLRHRSGIHNYTDDEDFYTYLNTPMSREQLIDRFMKLPSDFTPGSQFSYSNTNYILLGFILEDVTKKTYEQLLNERIINKLELKNTYYGTPSDIKKNEARSYTFNGSKWIFAGETDPSQAGAAGIMVSNPADMTRFIEAIFKNTLLSQPMVDQMISLKDGYGLGIYSVPFYDKVAFGHNGSIDGFESNLYYFPAEKLSIAVVSNGINEDLNQLLIGILSIYFNMDFTIPKFYSVEVDEKILDDYVGEYYCETLKLDFTVTKEGNVIVGQPSGQSAIALDSRNDRLFVYEPAGVEIEFNRDGTNHTTSLTLRQGGATFTFMKLK